MFQVEVVQEIKTHILFFFSENHTCYEIIWKNGGGQYVLCMLNY